MTERMTPDEFHAAQGVEDWRVLGEGAHAFYRTGSFAESARFIDVIAGLPGLDDQQPDIDIRRDGVTVRLITGTDDYRGMTQRDLAMARRISGVAREMGIPADPTAVQTLLVVPGAPAGVEVVAFWQALLGYERRADSPDDDLVDPLDRNVPFWFEMMDEPRADGGGAIHVAVWVPPEQAEARVAAALAAGGRLVRDEFAPSWWTLADAAGNEADVATTKGRD